MTKRNLVNPWKTRLRAITNEPLISALEGLEGAFGATITELFFVGGKTTQRVRLTDISRVARSGAFVIISGPQGELIRVKFNVSNDQLLSFFKALKVVASSTKLQQTASGPAQPATEVNLLPEPEPVLLTDDAPLVVPAEPDKPGSERLPGRATRKLSQTATVRIEPSIMPGPVSATSGTPAPLLQPSPNSSSLNALYSNPFDSEYAPAQGMPRGGSRPATSSDATVASSFWPDLLDPLSVESSFDHLRAMSDHTIPERLPPFVSRLAAASLDAALFLAVQTLLSRLLGIYPGTVVDLFSMGTARWTGAPLMLAYDVLAVIAYTLVLSWPYFALMESAPWQATPGKLVLRLYVTDLAGRTPDFGRATWRHLARIVPLMAGFAVLMLGTLLSWWLIPDRDSILALLTILVAALLALGVLVRTYRQIGRDPHGQTVYDRLAGCLVQQHDARPASRKAMPGQSAQASGSSPLPRKP